MCATSSLPLHLSPLLRVGAEANYPSARGALANAKAPSCRASSTRFEVVTGRRPSATWHARRPRQSGLNDCENDFVQCNLGRNETRHAASRAPLLSLPSLGQPPIVLLATQAVPLPTERLLLLWPRPCRPRRPGPRPLAHRRIRSSTRLNLPRRPARERVARSDPSERNERLLRLTLGPNHARWRAGLETEEEVSKRKGQCGRHLAPTDLSVGRDDTRLTAESANGDGQLPRQLAGRRN